MMEIKELIVKLSLDGDQWCALVGDNLQEGIAGFDSSPNLAIKNLAVEAESTAIDLYDLAF